MSSFEINKIAGAILTVALAGIVRYIDAVTSRYYEKTVLFIGESVGIGVQKCCRIACGI